MPGHLHSKVFLFLSHLPLVIPEVPSTIYIPGIALPCQLTGSVLPDIS